MKAVGYRNSLPITDAQSLVDVEIPDPVPAARDLLVSVKAISVNPVDTKVRMRAAAGPGEIKVLGYDASGVVKAVGPEVKLFRPGDEVFCSDLTFSASANPIVYQGGVPVFIDCERSTWNMDPVLLAAALADRAAKGRSTARSFRGHNAGILQPFD